MQHACFAILWHYEGSTPSRRPFCLFWCDTKQRPELEIFDATGSGVGKAGPREDRGQLEKGTQREQLAKGDAEGQSTTDSRRDQSGEIESRGSEEDRKDEFAVLSRQRSAAVRKMVKDESAFLVACRSFAKKCTSALVYRNTGNAVLQNSLLALWVDLNPYCSFVLYSFSPNLSVVFLVAIKKCEMPRRKPLDESSAKTELFRSWCIGVASGYCHNTVGQ